MTIPSSWLTESCAFCGDVRGVVDGDVGVVGERRLDRRPWLSAGSTPGALFIRMAPSSSEVTLAAKSGMVIT